MKSITCISLVIVYIFTDKMEFAIHVLLWSVYHSLLHLFNL